MLNRKIILMMILSLTFLLSACGGGSGTGTTNTGTSGGGSSKLVVYSNSVSDGRGDWLKEQAAAAGFELEFVEASGGDIYNRLLAEKAAPQADVTFGMDESFFIKMNDDSLLREFTPSWSSDVPAEAVTGTNYFYQIVEQHVFMIYNPEFVTNPPTNW